QPGQGGAEDDDAQLRHPALARGQGRDALGGHVQGVFGQFGDGGGGDQQQDRGQAGGGVGAGSGRDLVQGAHRVVHPARGGELAGQAEGGADHGAVGAPDGLVVLLRVGAPLLAVAGIPVLEHQFGGGG